MTMESIRKKARDIFTKKAENGQDVASSPNLSNAAEDSRSQHFSASRRVEPPVRKAPYLDLQLPQEGSFVDPRKISDDKQRSLEIARNPDLQATTEDPRRGLGHADLNKRLPPRPPTHENPAASGPGPVRKPVPGHQKPRRNERVDLPELHPRERTSKDPPAHKKTEDMTLHRQWAAPVTHETVRHDVHNVREKRIDREVHEYHVHHRIQPIVETEVLPARHFVPVDGHLREISEDQVTPWLESQVHT